MKGQRNVHPVYTDDYYRMEKLISSARFQNRVIWLTEKYTDHGCPIPKHGFRKYEGYMKWLNDFWGTWSKINYSEDMKAAKKKIADSDSLSGEEKFVEIDKLETEKLPPVPGQFIEDILLESKIDPRNEKYKNFLERYIFFGQKHLSETYSSIRWTKNERTKEPELFVRIFPYTKLEHIAKFWDQVMEEQKSFPDYVGKSKKWTTFERDLSIYNTWQEAKTEIEHRPLKKRWFEAGRPPLDEFVWAKVSKEFPKITIQQIRKAVSRVAELDK